MANAVVKSNRDTIKKWFDSPQFLQYLGRVLPADMDSSRVLQIYYNVVSASPELQDCSAQSLIKVILFGSQLGLSFDPHLRQAWIVAYGKNATMIVGYKGLEKLVIQSGYADAIDAVTVYENDEFDIEEGQTPKLFHKPNYFKDRGAKIGVYARAFRPNGTIRFRFVPWSEIEKHRNAGASRNSPAWKNWDEEMAEKTAIRILCKRLPQNEKTQALHRLVSADELSESAPEKQALGLIDADDILEGEIEESEQKQTKTATIKETLKTAKKSAASAADSLDPRQDILVKINAAAVALFKSQAEADVEVSAALGGRIQSVASLDEHATTDDLKAVLTHFSGIADAQ